MPTITVKINNSTYAVDVPTAAWPENPAADEIRVALERYDPARRTYANFDADRRTKLTAIVSASLSKGTPIMWGGHTLTAVKVEEPKPTPTETANVPPQP